jgi:predicted nucleic acid-binding protein
MDLIMILVDTSVLIDYFKGVDNVGTQKFQFIQDNNINFGITNFIYLELLQGSKDDKEFETLKEYLETQIFYDVKSGKKSYEEASKIYNKCRKKGITIRSTIDIIICQIALENDLYLLHNDKDFEDILKVDIHLKIY